MSRDPVADLVASGELVRKAAQKAVTAGARNGATALKAARPGYRYGYGPKVAGGARVRNARAVDADTFEASIRIGGSGAVFSGGGSLTNIVFGAEFGAKTGDLRVGLQGRKRIRHKTVSNAEARSLLAKGKVVHIRRGGLRQFPTRKRSGWFLTPAIDRASERMDAETERAFAAALDKGA